MDRPERNRSWAPGIEPITIGQLDLIGVDSERNLYWDGERLKIERRLKLSRLQSVSAFIVLISTFVGGVGAGFQGWSAICQTNPTWAHYVCPASKREQVERGVPKVMNMTAPGNAGIGWASICQKRFYMCPTPQKE